MISYSRRVQYFNTYYFYYFFKLNRNIVYTFIEDLQQNVISQKKIFCWRSSINEYTPVKPR